MRSLSLLPLLLVPYLGAAPIPAQTGIDERFACGLPPADESRWTLIPWRTSLTDALAEAERLDRPIYLFVNDGDIESGRC